MPTATEVKLNTLVNLTLDQIGNGRIDDRLEEIMAECSERRRVVRDQLARRNARALGKPGTKVRLINISPKYLTGIEGTVVEKPKDWLSRKAAKPGTLYVDVGYKVRNKYGPVLGVPPACLEAA